MRIITENIIRSLNISPEKCVKWVYESFAQKPSCQLPAKVSVHPDEMDFFTTMPCLLPRPSVQGQRRYFGVKEVHRIEGAVPSLGSDMMLYDAGKGELLALVDCDWITAMRTGAVAAVSIKALQRADAKVYGFVGLGNTARSTMLCMLAAEPERMFRVKLLEYKDQAPLFIERFKDFDNVEFEIVKDINELACSVDVFISCITSAHGLLVEDEKMFQPGVTVIPVHMRGLQNCDTTFDRVFGDDTAHVCNFKYFKQYRDYNEIGEVLAGRDPGRRSPQQRIIDYNYGLALHDVYYASKIYELLETAGLQDVEYTKEQQKYWI